jgi:hypothetical protein
LSLVQTMGGLGTPGALASTAATVALGSGSPAASITLPRITLACISFTVIRWAGAWTGGFTGSGRQPNFDTFST